MYYTYYDFFIRIPHFARDLNCVPVLLIIRALLSKVRTDDGDDDDDVIGSGTLKWPAISIEKQVVG